MEVPTKMNPLAWLRKQLDDGGNDLVQEMVKAFAEQLMSAEADALCGAGWGQRSEDRVNRRNGYRPRAFDTRAGTIELAIPKLRQGSYFPDWLLEPRRRAERALVAVVAQCYLEGVSTRRVEDVARALGIERLSKSQVSEMARSLDSLVEAFRARPLDGGPYTYLWVDALTQRVREDGRVQHVAVWRRTSLRRRPSRCSTLSPPGPGMLVVDVPTGSGAIVTAGQRRGANMVGVDIAEAMIRLAARNNPGADLRQGAAEQLPVETGTAHALVSAYGMPHFADHRAFFAEAHRVLRPGGRFAYATWYPPPKNQHIGLVLSTLMRLGNLDVGLPPGPDVFRYADPDICKAELFAAGFTDVVATDLPIEWRSPDGAPGLVASIESGAVRSRALYRAQTREVKLAVLDALADGLAPYRGDDGVFRVPATSILVTALRA